MGLEFRPRRELSAEEQTRTRANIHPLSSPSIKVEVADCGTHAFFDPLRAAMESGNEDCIPEPMVPDESSVQLSGPKEWNNFKKILMQRFPISKTNPVVSGVLANSNKGAFGDYKFLDDDKDMFINQQACLSKLQELKVEINQSWCADDRVTSLKLSIKVARLLMDTSVIQLYPALFVLTTDIMDMLGDMVWDRIKQKAETREGRLFCSLSDNFQAGDICFEAKETCNNWFSKIGSVRELLPRIYLELAILPCWRFINDHPQDILQRLVLMTRGISDPLASAYCRLYLVRCAQRLPEHDTGFLVTCININDVKLLVMRLSLARQSMDGNHSGHCTSSLTIIEPTIEYIMKCLFKNIKKTELSDILVSLGMGKNQANSSETCPYISIILHYILKELPVGFTCLNSMEILDLIECANDSSFDQSLNFKLLGHRLCERISEVSKVHLVMERIIQVMSCYDNLDAYLMVADAYVDIFLENQSVTFLNVILDGIFERAQVKKFGENRLVILQSIFLKIITRFSNIKTILALNHFIDILDLMHGSSRKSISMLILTKATRNGQIQDPTSIEVLLDFAQLLYDDLDFSNMRKDEYQHPARLISHFVLLVDYGADVESQFRFLAQCRGCFANITELQEMLVHSNNNLAVGAMKDGRSGIVKSCLAFSEVTILAIPAHLRRLNLYLETAEVALLGGFISHSDGLIDAAVNCLQYLESVNGVEMGEDVDGIVSLICKLCGLLVIVPGITLLNCNFPNVPGVIAFSSLNEGRLEQGVAWITNHVLSFLDSQSWILPGKKTKVLSAIVFMSAALSQNQHPYHNFNVKVIHNYQLFFGVQSYHQELLSLSGVVLQRFLMIVMQEPSMVLRGKMALEGCNCIASSFLVSDETLDTCSKLVEIAKSCSSADDMFLQSTLRFLKSHKFLV